MKKNNPSEEKIVEKLPFSFKKKEVSVEKINAHWQKIAAKIVQSDDQIKLDPEKETKK